MVKKEGKSMILNSKKWQSFENNLRRKEKIDINKNFKIVDALYREAVELKILPMKDPLEGLDVKIKITKVINSVDLCSSDIK